MATIIRGNSGKVRPNFTHAELFSTSYGRFTDAPSDSHFLSDKTLDGLQIIRDWSGKKRIRVTSTWRSDLHQAALIAGGTGAQLSPHTTGHAIDFQWTGGNDEMIRAFYNDMACKGPLYQKLKSAGIRGIGVYRTFIHIDDGLNPRNVRQVFTFWDKSAGKYGDINLSTAYMATVPEEGAGNCGLVMDAGEEAFPAEKKNALQRLFDRDPEDGMKANIQTLTIAGIGVLTLAIIFVLWWPFNKR